MSKQKNNIESILSLDKIIHEPARLAILTALMEIESSDFKFLLNVTGLTKGNISSHLEKLSQAGLITIEKKFIKKMPNTLISLTSEGKESIKHYWETIKNLGKTITKN